MTIKKTILITGCSSGIGQCVARGLRDDGYIVYPTARKQSDVQALIDEGFDALQLDYADYASVENAFTQLMEKTQHQFYLPYFTTALMVSRVPSKTFHGQHWKDNSPPMYLAGIN